MINTMPVLDALRWDERYRNMPRQSFEAPRPYLVAQAKRLPKAGLALDAAMGLGGNAGFLLQHGLHVVGIDISNVAVQRARECLPGLLAVIGDLTNFYLPPAAFAVIVNFYYLERSLWPCYVQALQPGGLLIFETLTSEMLTIHPEIEPQHLLAPGELRQGFPGLELLDYQEQWVEMGSRHPRAVASLTARKPPAG
jgi:hypothetical protein